MNATKTTKEETKSRKKEKTGCNKTKKGLK
jgi:hypothetical protein